MGWFENEELVAVELDCRCPKKPHEKDTVWLYPRLTIEGGLAGQQVWDSILEEMPTVEYLTGKLGTTFVAHGIAGWTFVDDNGQPIPSSARNIARFARNWEAARPVAEKADELYAEQLLAPLAERLSTSSQRGPTGGSTSPSRTTSRKPRKPSRSSTTATSRPRLQVMTNSGGDSSSSPKRRSASA